MKVIVIAGMVLMLGIGVKAYGEDVPVAAKIPPPDVRVKVAAPPGTSDADIAAGIAAENARRDPIAKQEALAAKRKAEKEAAHHERVRKVCDSIPEHSKATDPSLRKMCE